MNNSLQTKYLKEIRSLLPILRREEKEYLRKMAENIEETRLIENVDLETLDDYYKVFGEPKDIIHQYYTEMDMNSFYKIISRRRLIRQITGFVCILTLCLAVFECIIRYQEYKVFQDSKIASYTTEIIIYKEGHP